MNTPETVATTAAKWSETFAMAVGTCADKWGLSFEQCWVPVMGAMIERGEAEGMDSVLRGFTAIWQDVLVNGQGMPMTAGTADLADKLAAAQVESVKVAAANLAAKVAAS